MGIELQRDGRRNEKLKTVVNAIARFSSLDDSVDFTKNFSELAFYPFSLFLWFSNDEFSNYVFVFLLKYLFHLYL